MWKDWVPLHLHKTIESAKTEQNWHRWASNSTPFNWHSHTQCIIVANIHIYRQTLTWSYTQRIESDAKMNLTWIPFNSFSQMALINSKMILESISDLMLAANAQTEANEFDERFVECVPIATLASIHTLSFCVAVFFSSFLRLCLCIKNFFFIYPCVVRRSIFVWLSEWASSFYIEVAMISAVCI